MSAHPHTIPQASHGTDTFPLPLVYQPACECLGDRVDGRRILYQRPLKSSIVAEGHDAASWNIGEKLPWPEEARTVIGLVRPGLFRIAIQAMEEDIAGGTGLSAAIWRTLVPETYSTAMSPSIAPSRTVSPSRAIPCITGLTCSLYLD